MPLANTNLQIKTKKQTRFDFNSVADTYDKWYETAAITTLEFVRDSDAVLQEMIRCTRKSGRILH
jgi:hypothetical protein